jgi:hypothetical protein
MYLRTNPITNLRELYSSFFAQQIEFDRYALTACRGEFFLEHMKRGFLPETRRIHLVPRESEVRIVSGPFQTSKPTGDGGFELVNLRRLPPLMDRSQQQYFQMNSWQRDQFLSTIQHFERQFQNSVDLHSIGRIGYVSFVVRFLEQSGMARRIGY